MVLRAFLRHRFYLFAVRFLILTFCNDIVREEGRRTWTEDNMLIIFETDADVIGLWAQIESAVYKELKSKKGGDHRNWDGNHQEFVAKSE